MKKLYTLLLVFMCAAGFAQQQILLFTETFENGNTSLNFTGGGVGSNTGTNSWIINNQYNGAPVYPVTPPQDSIVSGTISGAPNSTYLHIHDANAASVANCNWNTNDSSDRFAYIGRPFCTLGLTDVIFTFFWISEGAPADAYGEVYYRINGGAWIKTGQAEYAGQSKWKYEVIQDPAFNNAQNLQLGFRWVNKATGGPNTVAFGIDDIIAVGTYDDVNNPVTINVTGVSSDTICQGDAFVVSYQLSAPLCDGQYYIELSSKNGVFGPNANTNRFITIPGGVLNGAFQMDAPDSLGNCFKIRMRRTTEPAIAGAASACFTVIDCPEFIITNNAPVMTDGDTACVLSVIDIKFNSFGFYNIGNRYFAELSDTNGSFATPFLLGNNFTNQAFPSSPPGNISGLIPQGVPPGCGYYIRVRSSSPSVTGTLIGPFCLTRCDELTNFHTDIKLCIPDSIPFPSCTTLNIDRNYWDTLATYDTCNNWTIELRSMMTFALVNSGGIGVYHDSLGGNFQLCLPATAAQLPVPAGTYYMRLVSNCSSQPWNQTGSVIRITIGTPSQNKPTILGLQPDTVFCNGAGIFGLQVVPYNQESKYWWSSQIFNNGEEFLRDPPPNFFYGNIAGATPGEYKFYVREQNYGCYGPFSDPYVYTIITVPNLDTVSGPPVVCLGDTVSYFVSFQKETYYNWDAPAGVRILDEANNQITVIFDSLGTFTLSIFSLNDCGGDSGFVSVKVTTLFNVNAGDDKNVCVGDTISLKASTDDLDKVLSTIEAATDGKPGAMFNIIAHSDVIIDSFAVKFLSAQPVNLQIYSKSGSYRGFEQSQFSWNQVGGYNGLTPEPVGRLTIIPNFLNQPLAAGDTIAYYVTTSNNIKEAISTGTPPNGSVYKTDGVIDFVNGSANDYPFSTFIGPRVLNMRIYYSTRAGLSYSWSTGDTTDAIRYPAFTDSTFMVQVSDTSGCKNRDSVLVVVKPKPIVDAGTDTIICAGNIYALQGQTNATTVEWTPADGLSATDILNPVWVYNQPVVYYLNATSEFGCKSSDSVKIDVIAITVNAGADTTLCDGETYQLQATSSASDVVWSPVTGLSAANILTPQFNNPVGFEYVLTATDLLSGCSLSDTVKIDIGPCSSYLKVPGAFTPNGQGENNYFTVFGKNIDQYEIRIFNRWGEVVYSSRDVIELNDLNRGWDGTLDGKLQQTGTFAYYINARDRGGKVIEKKGNLTLIR